MFTDSLFPAFPTDIHSVYEKVKRINPVAYGKSRNFIDGAVTKLSPYISRGMITLPEIMQQLKEKGYELIQMEKFVQELCWREFFQRVWWEKRDLLFEDLKQPQHNVDHHQIPTAVVEARTGIDAIDSQIREWYQTGYLHNHIRMYIASIVCNIGQSHWKIPSRWMYYHLLDGDPASNTCSWQWVAGSFSSKKYYANQDNINRYLGTNQQNSFLNHSYERLTTIETPDVLKETTIPYLKTKLPANTAELNIDRDKPICIYTSFWLHPKWRIDMNANRVLLLEPSHFEQFPVSEKVLNFILSAGKENIPGLQVFVGAFSELKNFLHPAQDIYFLNHPLHTHFKGHADDYPWLIPELTGTFSSFFSFWKKAEKELKRKW